LYFKDIGFISYLYKKGKQTIC